MVSVVTANLMQPTWYTAWRPTWRLHLTHALLVALITLFSITAAQPLYASMIVFEVVGGLALALCSRFSWPGALLGSAMAWAGTLMMTDVSISPGIIPWLCTAVLVAHGLPRMPAYSLVVSSLVLSVADARQGEASEGWVSLLAWWVVAGGGAITLAKLIHSSHDQAERSLHTYRESIRRQRLLMVTELHDTVVRDLTHAVMTAEQARLTHPQDAALTPRLDTMTAAVRAAVRQMWRALRTISDIHGGERLGIEAASAPRPLGAVIAGAATILGQRGARLEVEGLKLLGILVTPPGVRLQLLRVLGKLVSNMPKYTAPQGRARLAIESDERSLEAMASNDIGLPRQVNGVWVGADVPGSGVPGHDAFSSGLGLEGARRRMEALDGSLSVSQGEGCWTTVFSVPFQATS